MRGWAGGGGEGGVEGGAARGRIEGDGHPALIDTVGGEYDVALGVERWVWERRPDHTMILGVPYEKMN